MNPLLLTACLAMSDCSYSNFKSAGKSFGPKRDKNKRAMKKKSKRANRRNK